MYLCESLYSLKFLKIIDSFEVIEKTKGSFLALHAGCQ